MKKPFVLLFLCVLASACSSAVEKYIQNDFARTVRENGLEAEMHTEISSLTATLEEIADTVNPDEKTSREMLAKYKKMGQEIESRLKSYKRTGNYDYIWGIAQDAEECDALKVKADRLASKARPFTNHKNKQIKAFVSALKQVDAKALLNEENLVKNDSITVEYIFKHIIGGPNEMVTASEEELESVATAFLTNYFIDHPTPTIKTHTFQKDKDCWYISLSDGTRYYLRATKCDNGEYEYDYIPAEDAFSNGASLNTKE